MPAEVQIQKRTVVKLTFYDTPDIVSTSFEAHVGDSVRFQSVGKGGKLPYTWSAVALPPGLAIDPATGMITGKYTGPARTLDVELILDTAPMVQA